MNRHLQDLMRDLWLHLKRTRCIVARRHVDLHDIGLMAKPGYRGIPIQQCHFCAEIIVVSDSAAKVFGGK